MLGAAPFVGPGRLDTGCRTALGPHRDDPVRVHLHIQLASLQLDDNRHSLARRSSESRTAPSEWTSRDLDSISDVHREASDSFVIYLS